MRIYFFLIIVAYLIGNLYVFIRALQTFSNFSIGRKLLLAIIFWEIALSLVWPMMLRGVDMPDWLSKTLFQVGSCWLIFTLYMVLSLFLFDLCALFFSFKRRFYVALGLTLCLLMYGYYNYRHPRVLEIPIALEKPLATGERRIVAISDVHLGHGTDKVALKKYVELINWQKPDLILIGGDLIDNSLEPLYEQNMAEELSQLQAPMGIFMVPGNHEYISGIRACEQFLKNTPIRLLRDSVVTLPNGIQLVGRDDRSNQRGRLSLKEIATLRDSSYFSILIDHQPYNLAQKDSLKFDLQFSGHTHNGQVWPMTILIDRMYEQSHGYRKWSHSHVFVSSGLSLWGPPFRIGTHSDLAVFVLK